MSNHYISINNFNDAYILSYGAGCMGDFFAGLIIYSFNLKFNKPLALECPDSFYYEPWSKKWISKDSSILLFRDYFLARRTVPPVGQTTSLDKFSCDFGIPVDKINSESELAHLLLSIIHPDKSPVIPYLFVSENMFIYTRDDLKAQVIPNVNFIDAQIRDKKYLPLYFILPLYKHHLHNHESKISSLLNKENFIQQAGEMMFKIKNDQLIYGRTGSLQSKILKVKKYHDFDMMKLILNHDRQDLDFLVTDTAFGKNMINVAKRDMFEILDFFDLDIDDLLNIDDKKLHDMYDKISSL